VDAQLKTVLTQPLDALIKWADNRPELRAIAQQYGELAQAGTQRLLPGLTWRAQYLDVDAARARSAWRITSRTLVQLAAMGFTGCEVLWPDDALHRDLAKQLPKAVSARIHFAKAGCGLTQPFDAVIYHGDSDQLRELCEQVAARSGAIVSVQGFGARRDQPAAGTPVRGALAQRQHRCSGR
jgi:RHH-type proline utilization regulon transcriptional repressor/proline dehydrogenase/delta 1-pyrroline-5-carboxylate dehydrogenase